MSDGFVGLHKLVQFFGQLLVLVSDHSDVVVQRIDFDLQVRVVVQQCRVGVPGALQLFPHVHNLVLLGSDLGLEFLDVVCQLNVPAAL